MAKRAVDDRRDEDVSYPRLSTTDRGGRITQLPPDRSPGRFDGVMAAECAAAALFWAAGTGMLAAALFEQPGSALGHVLGQPVPVVAALVIAVLALYATVALRHRIAEAFGQSRVASITGGTAFWGGLTLGIGGWSIVTYAVHPTPPFDLTAVVASPTIPRELGVLAAAASGITLLVFLVRLGPAFAHARSRQSTIARLRADGTRRVGTLSERRFRNLWVSDQPIFDGTVTFPSGTGTASVPVRMTTIASRVPVVGSQLVVITDRTGAIIVELDPAAPTEFEPDALFAAPEG